MRHFVMPFGANEPADNSVEARLGRLIEPQPDGCWTMPTVARPYPQFHIYGKQRLVHRWLYFLMNRIDEAEHAEGHVHHNCGNPHCVNPHHMTLLTPQDHRDLHAAAR